MSPNNALSSSTSNTNTLSKLRPSLDLAKRASNAWRLAILLSLAIVLQALGSNRSINASSINSSLTRHHKGQTKSNSTRREDIIFLPRLLNLVAIPTTLSSATWSSATSLSAEFSSELADLQLGTPQPTSLQPADRSQIQLADTKSLTKPSAPKVHQVKQGETITAIANEYQVSSSKLVEVNRLANSNIIFVDQRLTIPNDRDRDNLASLELPEPTTDVNSKTTNDNLPSQLLQPATDDPYINKLRIEIEQRRAQYRQEQAATQLEPSLISAAEPVENTEVDSETATSVPQTQSSKAIVRRNLQSEAENSLALVLPPLLDSQEYLPSAFDGYIWPAQGVFTSGYGWRWGRMHRGIDIAAPVGTPIVAAAAGTVIGSGWHSGYGNLIKLEHLDGSITYYAHNHRNLVTHGQKVRQGEQIAEMGNTGQSTGSHLHFEIHLPDKKVVDPLALLGSR